MGISTPNLPSSETFIELIGHKDLGGGLKQTVRIPRAVVSGQVGGSLAFATKAALDAATGYENNREGEVFADPTPANNGVYRYNSGPATWTKIADLGVDVLDARLDTLEGQTLDARLDVIEGQTLDARLDTLEGQTLDTRLDTLEGQTLDTRLDVLEGQTLDARLDVIETIGPIAISDLEVDAIYSPVALNGAIQGRDTRTLTIPVGQHGRNTTLGMQIPMLQFGVGTQVTFKPVFIASVSVGVETPISLTAVIHDRAGTSSTVAGVLTADGTQIWRGSYTRTITATDEDVELLLVVSGSASVRTTEASIFVSSVDADVIVAVAPAQRDSETVQYREAITALRALRSHRVLRERFAIADGGGDYSAISTMMLEVGQGGGPSLPVRGVVFPGMYGELNVTPHDFSEIVGRGPEHEQILNSRSAYVLAGIGDRSPMQIKKTTKVKNLTVWGENTWHTIHAEAGNARRHDAQVFEDLTVQNFGTGVGGSATGFGIGNHDGNKQIFRRCRAISPGSPTGGLAFGAHNNVDWEYGAEIEAYDCLFGAPDADGIAVALTSMGAGLMSSAVFRNCALGGLVKIDTGVWLSTRIVTHRGYRYEWKAIFDSCNPFDWFSDCPVDVVELRSVAGASSAVALSGTGRPYLFGSSPFVKPGGVGYAGRAYSQFAITTSVNDAGGMPVVSLAARLGNLSVATKTLTIAFDGTAPVNITLDVDYSAMSNAAIISSLNTKLDTAMGGSSGGRLFLVTTAPHQNRAPLYQPSREGFEKNSDTTAILKGHMLKWDGRNVKLMTSADAIDLFAGIALEEAMPGKVCRFQRSGWINEVHLLFTGSPSIAVRDQFEVGATPGELVEGATRPLLRAHHSYSSPGSTFEFIGAPN